MVFLSGWRVWKLFFKTMQDKFIVINAKLLDPISQNYNVCNLLFNKGKVVGMGYLPDDSDEDQPIIDASDAFLFPPFYDMPLPQESSANCSEIFSEFKTLHLQFLTQVSVDISYEALLDLKRTGIRALDLVLNPKRMENLDEFFINIHRLSLSVRVSAIPGFQDLEWMPAVCESFSHSKGGLLLIGPITSEAMCDQLATLKKSRSDILAFATLFQLLFSKDSVASKNALDFYPLISEKEQSFLQQAVKGAVIDIVQTGLHQACFTQSRTSLTEKEALFIDNEAWIWPLFSELWQKLSLDPLHVLDLFYVNPAAFLGLDIYPVEIGASPDLLLFDPNQECSEETKHFLDFKLGIKTDHGACRGLVKRGYWEVSL